MLALALDSLALLHGVTPMHAIGVPLVGALLLATDPHKPNVRETITFITCACLLVVVLSLLPQAMAETPTVHTLVEMFPGMSLSFHVEPLGMIYALIAASLWVLNSCYSVGYMRGNKEKHQTRFYVCFATSIASVMGIAFSANLFSLFVCYEALSLATFPLVTHKGSPAAVRAGRTYLGILMGTSVGLLLPAMLGVYAYSGTLDFTPGGVLGPSVADGKVPVFVLEILFLMAIYGIGKAALMPGHRWLPAAMVAPTPVSALLHAVAVVKAGVFSVVKVIVYIFGPATVVSQNAGYWLIVAAGCSIVLASFIALFQDNLKRRLAYSTVSQLSYITLGASLMSAAAIQGAALHIAAHAFGKITLFFAAGSIYTAAHLTNVSQLDGIGRRMPITMGAFTIGTLSMIGLPPTGGFVSKWFLLTGSWSAHEWFPIAVIITSTLLNAAYFLPIVYRAFFRAPPPADEHHPAHGEAPWPIVLALSGTALATVSMFFVPDVFLTLSERLVEHLR